MTWTKTGDEFADECWTLSDAAYRLHHEGLTWSNRKLLDGKLPKDDMTRWVHHPEAAEELVAVGWWEGHDGYYRIIHHIGYQRTRKQIAKQSIANAANANRRWAKPKNSKPSQNEALLSDVPHSLIQASPVPSISQCDSQCGSHDEERLDDLRAWYAEDEVGDRDE